MAIKWSSWKSSRTYQSLGLRVKNKGFENISDEDQWFESYHFYLNWRRLWRDHILLWPLRQTATIHRMVRGNGPNNSSHQGWKTLWQRRSWRWIRNLQHNDRNKSFTITRTSYSTMRNGHRRWWGKWILSYWNLYQEFEIKNWKSNCVFLFGQWSFGLWKNLAYKFIKRNVSSYCQSWRPHWRCSQRWYIRHCTFTF